LQEIEKALAQMVIDKTIADALTKMELDRTFQDAFEISECFEKSVNEMISIHMLGEEVIIANSAFKVM